MQDKKPEEKVFEAKPVTWIKQQEELVICHHLGINPPEYQEAEIVEPKLLKSTLVITNKLLGL